MRETLSIVLHFLFQLFINSFIAINVSWKFIFCPSQQRKIILKDIKLFYAQAKKKKNT